MKQLYHVFNLVCILYTVSGQLHYDTINDISILSEILLDYSPSTRFELTPELCLNRECIPWCKFVENKQFYEMNDTDQDNHYIKSGVYAYTLCMGHLPEHSNTVVITETIPVDCIMSPCAELCDRPVRNPSVFLRSSRKHKHCVYKINYGMLLFIMSLSVFGMTIYVSILNHNKKRITKEEYHDISRYA